MAVERTMQDRNRKEKREGRDRSSRNFRKLPNKLRLLRGGGGGVGGCGVFAPLREISTSTRDTVSPEAREATEKKKGEKVR